jgi:class 3 adenylate cyclase
VDLRGAALGATVALSTWLIWQTGMLQPLQANSLIWLIQFRNEPWVLERRGTRLELGQGEAPSQVVLLSHDQAGYEAVHRSSECAVLAQAIRRLHGGGAQLVLAPVPLLDVSAEQPEPIRQLVQRNRRDLPLLQTAARAGKVVWVAPPMERLPPEAQALLREGKAVGSMDRIRYFAPGLPVFERGGNRESPALAAVQSLGTRPQDTQRQRLLITDFYGEQPGEAFTRVPLGAVLTGKPFYLVGAHHTVREEFLLQQQRVPPRLVPPQQLLKGNIVILPFWGPDTYATPIGRMDPQELIAHQLASLLRGDTIRMPPPGWVLGVLMVLGMVSGHLCLRRAPVQAWWTAVLIALLVWLSSIGLFLVARLWFDPLLSVLSVAGTALLVSQLTFASESAERARQRALLQRLVAPEVAEQLLEDFETRLQAGGMRSQIAVLFADIRHFTRFAETHTPEQVIERLNRLLGVLTETLHAHRGILDKYTGDGLMAIFAVHLLPQPESEEQLICRVVRAAIAMQHALQSVEPAGDSALGMGIGIHFGEAVLGLLGSHAQFNYTAVGRTVVIAARLQALAAAGEIVLSEPVYEVARAAGIVPDLPPETVQLKGMSAPCVVYRLHVPDKASEPSPSVLHAEERVKL